MGSCCSGTRHHGKQSMSNCRGYPGQSHYCVDAQLRHSPLRCSSPSSCDQSSQACRSDSKCGGCNVAQFSPEGNWKAESQDLAHLKSHRDGPALSLVTSRSRLVSSIYTRNTAVSCSATVSTWILSPGRPAA
jgi:hypothetical protein